MRERLKQAVLKTHLPIGSCTESITYGHDESWYSGAVLQFGNRMCNHYATPAPPDCLCTHAIEDPSSSLRLGDQWAVTQLDLSASCAGHIS
jgi:hypothetical protein